MKVQDITNVFKGRSVAYNVFSRVFIDIPDETSDVFYMETLPHMLSIADASDNKNMKKGAELLREFFGSDDEMVERMADTRLERSKDYTKLFILGKISIPIYESIYNSVQNLTKQEPWEEVKAFYAAHFFKRAQEDRTMEDHISMELQFVGLMSSKTASYMEVNNFDDAEDSINAQLEFNKKHLTSWAFLFCSKVESAIKELNTQFYPGYACLLKGFLEDDVEFLTDLSE